MSCLKYDVQLRLKFKIFGAMLALLTMLGVAGSVANAASVDIPAGTYKTDQRHTNVLWSVNHFGFSNYYARFRNIDATLELDAADIAKSTLSVTIDPKTIDTNYPAEPNPFNVEIASDMFLNADEFPQITFTSTAIEITGEKTGQITGDLTIRGVTKPVTLDVTLNNAGPHPFTQAPMIGFSATGSFKRSEFGVDALVGPIGDDVGLIIEAEFQPAA